MSSISINNCVFMGRLTGEPEMRYTHTMPCTMRRQRCSATSLSVTARSDHMGKSIEAEAAEQRLREDEKLSGGTPHHIRQNILLARRSELINHLTQSKKSFGGA